MVKLTPDAQALFASAHPDAFAPAKGGWGRSGSTLVRLARADATVVHDALGKAWRNVAPKRLSAAID
ncbi:MAG TPA: hypothetical protein VJ696_14540 [Rhodanobacteraceae bacterium]|nr:hypothetical protein [Rhodanobacteraceae bacterium]